MVFCDLDFGFPRASSYDGSMIRTGRGDWGPCHLGDLIDAPVNLIKARLPSHCKNVREEARYRGEIVLAFA